MTAHHEPGAESLSEVRLVGRLGSTIEERVLPSGDELCSFSVIVDRRPRERRGRIRVDTIPCVAMRAAVSRQVLAGEPGQWIEATGVLRRRFWRGGSGLGSSVEVEVRTVRRIRG